MTVRTKIGEELARNLVEAAEKSVGAHHSEPYRLRIKYLCEDPDVLRRRLKDLARDVERKLDDHEVGKLMITIDGVSPLTAACLIAELSLQAVASLDYRQKLLAKRHENGR